MAYITKDEVSLAMDKLAAKGIDVSVQKVRSELGDRGSNSTISKFIKEIENEKNEPFSEQNISNRILLLIQNLSNEIKNESEAILERKTSQIDARIIAKINELNIIEEQKKSLANELSLALSNIEELKKKISKTEESLMNSESDRILSNKNLDSLNERYVLLISSIEEHKSDKNRLIKKTENLQETINQTIKEYSEENKDLSKQITLFESKNISLQGNLLLKTNTINSLNKRILSLEESISNLNDELSSKRNELLLTMKSLENEANIKNGLIKDNIYHKEQLREVSDELIRTQTSLEISEKNNARMEAENTSLLLKVSKMEAELKEKNKEVKVDK